MVGVNHVHILKIHRSRFVSQVHGVLERHAPYGECLKLCVSRLHAALMLVVELAQAGSHLAAAGARGSNHHQAAAGHHKLILAISIFADDSLQV